MNNIKNMLYEKNINATLEYLNSKNYKKAMECINKAIYTEYDTQLENYNVSLHYLRGITRFHLEDYYGAIADFYFLTELEPYSAIGYYWQGLTKYKLHNPENALTDFDRALNKNNDFTNDFDYLDTYYWRGRAKEDLEFYYEALEDYEEVLKVVPDDQEVIERKNVIKRILKLSMKSKENFIKYKNLNFERDSLIKMFKKDFNVSSVKELKKSEQKLLNLILEVRCEKPISINIK